MKKKKGVLITGRPGGSDVQPLFYLPDMGSICFSTAPITWML